MITRYFLNWEYGIHHLTIETNMRDMLLVIDELRKEFEITISESDKMLGEYRKAHVIVYTIENYYGQSVVIAYSSEESNI